MCQGTGIGKTDRPMQPELLPGDYFIHVRTGVRYVCHDPKVMDKTP